MANTISSPRQLRAAYPYMFRDYARGSPYHFHRGWFPLIAQACQRIDAIVGDDPFRHEFAWAQIKEKFGTLRLYWHARGARAVRVNVISPEGIESFSRASPADDHDEMVADQIGEIVDAAMKQSAEVCLVCGAAGVLRTGGWWATLCDTHFAMREAGSVPSPAFGAEEL